MTKRRKRLSRKLHRWYLEMGVIDASLDRRWRLRLFHAPIGKVFLIDAHHTQGLPNDIAYGVQRYRLEYRVKRVPAAQTPFEGYGDDSFKFFCFQAIRHPDLVDFSANNPDYF